MVLELFASVAQADPAPIAAGMLLLLALGMYPVGILLPSCCGCKACEECPAGILPDTVTVTFPEIDDEMLGAYRHRIAVSTTTAWAAGAGKVSARVSETVAGEITAVEILDGGSGYALKGRIAPTLTITGGGGTGATFTPTLTSSGTPAVWTLASATASGGTGYVDGAPLTITAAAGDTVTTKATATVVARGQPTLAATSARGAGASLAVTLSQSGSPPTWSVASVSVAAGGTGYEHGRAVLFSRGEAIVVTKAAATVKTLEQAAHTIDASGAGGTGATFAITYEADWEYPDVWYITGVSVTNGGSGYSAGGAVLLKPQTGTRYGLWPDGNPGDLELGYTVEDGAITGVSGFDNESYYRNRGIIQSVEVTNGGSYYLPVGAAYGVTVTDGGSFYREDATADPYVATVSTTVENASSGANAPSLTAVVDDDPASATFGEVTSFTITDGGGGHKYRTLHIGKRCCRDTFAEKSFVLKRSGSDVCQFVYEKCEGFGLSRMVLTIPPRNTAYGPQPCYLEVSTGDGLGGDPFPRNCYTRWTATTLLEDCSDFSFDMESGDRILTVAPGGTYHTGETPAICTRCCTSGALPDEIEVELESLDYVSGGVTLSDYTAVEGTYVLEANSSAGAWVYNGPTVTPNEDTVVLTVKFERCGEFTTPPGIRKQDPAESTDLVAVDGFLAPEQADALLRQLRQDVGVISADFEEPAAAPPPYPDGWPCPVGDIATPYADDAFPGTQVAAQDFVSHCGSDCNRGCFLVAELAAWNHETDDFYGETTFDDSKPYGAPFVHEEEAGREDHRDRIVEGFEVFFDYFDIPYCDGAWGWNAGAGAWQLTNPPLVEIANVWPGRDLSQATCDACQADLCNLTGKEITIARRVLGEYSPRAKLTIV